MMADMAEAIGLNDEAKAYREQFQRTKAAFAKKYLREDGSVNVNTQTAQALALFADLVPEEQRESTGRHLAKMLAENGNHMSTGFLGTRPLLPVLSAVGQNDLADVSNSISRIPLVGLRNLQRCHHHLGTLG